MWYLRVILRGLSFALMPMLVGCTNFSAPLIQSPFPTPIIIAEIEIPFETVALDEEGFVPLRSQESLLLLISSLEEVLTITERVSFDNLEKLKAVDFQQHTVIALFREMNLSTGYPTYIKRIVKRNEQLTIYAQFWKPPPISGQVLATTATYHLVKIAKQEQVSLKFSLVLEYEIVTPTPMAR